MNKLLTSIILSCFLLSSVAFSSELTEREIVLKLISENEQKINDLIADIAVKASELNKLKGAIEEAEKSKSQTFKIGIPIALVGTAVFILGAKKVSGVKPGGMDIDFSPLVKLFYAGIAAAGGVPAGTAVYFMYVSSERVTEVKEAIDQTQKQLDETNEKLKNDQAELERLKAAVGK